MRDTCALNARAWFTHRILVPLPQVNRNFVVFLMRLTKRRVDGLLQKPRLGIISDFNHGRERSLFCKALAKVFSGYVNSEYSVDFRINKIINHTRVNPNH